jgi:CheY-like chemotaxis protein
LSLHSDKRVEFHEAEPVPPLGLKLPKKPATVCNPTSRASEDDLVDPLEAATQEFGGGKGVNCVRPFPLSHMVGGFSARGTTPDDSTHSGSGLTRSPKSPEKLAMPERKKEQDRPVLIKYQRGEHSPGSMAGELQDFSAGLPSAFKCRTPTCVSFLPGKDIAENHSFLRAIVENNPLPSKASSRCLTQRQGHGQSLERLNHPCKCPIVLIVDDTEINKIVISGMLSRLGVLHMEASNGLEALEVLKRQNENKHCHCAGIKLVLMDCSMPVMNGFEATAEIRRMIEAQEMAPTTVIAVTAYEGTSIEQECKDSGMVEYLNKPVNIERLVQCLHKYLD